MICNVKDLRGYAIRTTDGVLGTVDDFYFDDRDWGIRYLVVDTGRRRSGRKVLISASAIGSLDRTTQELSVSLTKTQVKDSPDIDTRRPVSRYETEDFGDYGYPSYGNGAGLWGMGAYPGGLTTAGRIEEELRASRTRAARTSDDRHLRSSNAVTGYRVEATDGGIGHVEDLRVDDYTWAIRYLLVKTSNWWGGRRVLVATQRIEDVNWSKTTVSVDLTRQAIKDAPSCDAARQLGHERSSTCSSG
jgi:sporulation protein YlmC with PRC-barrel domain